MSMLGLKVGSTAPTSIVPVSKKRVRMSLRLEPTISVAIGRPMRGGVAGEDVAEIAGRHGEGDRAVGRAERSGGVDVIDDLRHDARPVDRVDRRQPDAVAEGGVVEQRLHQVLAVVEGAVDGDVVDVAATTVVICRRCTSEIAALGMQDEDVDARRGRGRPRWRPSRCRPRWRRRW